MCGVAGRFAVQGPLLGGRLDQGQFRLPAPRRELSLGDYDYDYDYGQAKEAEKSEMRTNGWTTAEWPCRSERGSIKFRFMLPADYHMHTPLCHHAVGQPAEYAAQALRVGLAEIGFSDHSPMQRDDFDDWRMRFDQLDQYVAMVREAQETCPGLIIKLALEVDYIPGQEDWIRLLAARHSWDYLIGSVHYVPTLPARDGAARPGEGAMGEIGERRTDTPDSGAASGEWDFDNPNKLSLWRERDAFDVWRAYFERLTQAAASGLFDIIGHADLAKKFCFYPAQDCTDLFREFLAAARANGTAIELNTAGLRKDCKEIYPSHRILELARDADVSITFGSDAHAPGEVGMDFESAIQLARGVGFTRRRVLTGRKASEVTL